MGDNDIVDSILDILNGTDTEDIVDTISDILKDTDIEDIKDIKDTVVDLAGNTSDIVVDVFDEILDELEDFPIGIVSRTPLECIRETHEPYYVQEKAIAGSVGWAVGLSFIVFFGTLLIVLLIRKFCCKDGCICCKSGCRCCGKKQKNLGSDDIVENEGDFVEDERNSDPDAKPSCLRKACSWFLILFFPMIFALITGILVTYWPQIPGINDCTQAFDVEQLVVNVQALDVSVPILVHLSLYNPNRIKATITELHGGIFYEDFEFGSFSFPEFTVEKRAITDVVFNFTLSVPRPRTVVDIYRDFYVYNNLTVSINMDLGIKVLGFTVQMTDFEIDVAPDGNKTDTNPGPPMPKGESLCLCAE